MIKDQPIQQFLDELASKASTPGGGSAAAIMAAMGAALGSMVGNFTVGKKGYEDVDAEMRETLAQTEQLRDKLTDMIRADIEVFNNVMNAYGMPKDTDDQKAERSQTIQKALCDATDVPLDCAQAAAEVLKLCKPLAEQGNKNVISDAGVAVLAAEAALRSAALNVYINIGSIKDEEFKQSRQQQLDEALAGTRDLTDEVYDIVKSRL